MSMESGRRCRGFRHNVAATPHHGPNALANAWSNALICLIPGR